MGRELAQAFVAARDVFREVDEALKQNLSQLMWEGPEDDLKLTENAQPALMAVSMAVVRVLETQGGWKVGEKVAYVAGHSLGQYSALAAAGSCSVAETAGLLKTRGRAMQKAVPVGLGAMAALIGVDPAQAKEIAAEAAQGDVCQMANDNAPGQVVVSGAKAAVERAMAVAAARGFKRAMLLPVSAPFHCSLMQPAADVMAEALSRAALKAPVVPLVDNVTAVAVTDPEEIRRLLVAQVTSAVRWSESVLYMKGQGVDAMVEAGAGKVLAGLVKRIDKEITAVSLQNPADIEAFLKD
jgi:[acyl-carrier-protein] S-malonyltransferase